MDSKYCSLFFISIILTAGIISIFCLPGPTSASEGFIGAESCLGCHDDIDDKFTHTLHGRAFSKSTPYYENRCEYCHGPGEEHEDNPTDETIITFGKHALSTVGKRNSQCLRCHDASRQIAMWKGSQHARQDISCDSCHTAHQGYDPTDRTSEACYKCHLNIKTDSIKQSRHPIREGKMGCGSCHNPHGTINDHMLLADSTNDLCYKCHADKRGPFMFEHSPVEEDCGICHTPHGSRHKKLLVQRTPSLCQNCHLGGHTSSRIWDQTRGFQGASPSNRYYGRSCITCHPNVHGSQVPSSRGKRFIY